MIMKAPKWILSFALAAVAGFAWSEVANDKCPVSGEPINAETAINVNGSEVAFCCEKCQSTFITGLNVEEKEEPGVCPISGKPAVAEQAIYHTSTKAMYFCCDNCLGKGIEKAGLEVKDEGPAACPISGKPASAENAMIHNGETVYFCCENCPKAYLEKVQAVDEGPETCPISGEPAKKEKLLILTTTKLVNFCCENCPKAYVEKHFEVK